MMLQSGQGRIFLLTFVMYWLWDIGNKYLINKKKRSCNSSFKSEGISISKYTKIKIPTVYSMYVF
jgi:hypothetical protein